MQADTNMTLIYLHLATVLPAFALGTWLLCNRKGTAVHRAAGRVFMVLMLATAVITLFMPAVVGPRVLGHFGFIHALSVLVLVTVPRAWIAIRNGRVQTHRNAMVGLYVGGLLVAGALAFMPGRLLHGWIFGG